VSENAGRVKAALVAALAGKRDSIGTQFMGGAIAAWRDHM